MYDVLAGGSKAKALRALKALPSTKVDGANSKAYAEAWVISR